MRMALNGEIKMFEEMKIKNTDGEDRKFFCSQCGDAKPFEDSKRQEYIEKGFPQHCGEPMILECKDWC